jgi:hypothetical protein
MAYALYLSAKKSVNFCKDIFAQAAMICKTVNLARNFLLNTKLQGTPYQAYRYSENKKKYS